MKKALFFVLVVFVAAPFVLADDHVTRSPDATLELTMAAASDGSLAYAFKADGKALIKSSPLGLDFGGTGKMPSGDWRVVKASTRSIDEVWKPVWGKRTNVPDRYNETIIEMQGPAKPFDRLNVRVRVYDDGVAFRYEIPAEANGQESKATKDLTGYNFADDYTAWFYNGEHHNLGPDKLSAVSGNRKPVMTLKAGDDAYLAIHEADFRSGHNCKFINLGRKSNLLFKLTLYRNWHILTVNHHFRFRVSLPFHHYTRVISRVLVSRGSDDQGRRAYKLTILDP